MRNRSHERETYIARVLAAHEYSGKKHDEIAGAIGVGRTTYTNWLSRCTMPKDHIAAFCKVTGVSEKWLITGEGSMVEADDKFLAIMKKIEDPQLKAELQELALQRILERMPS